MNPHDVLVRFRSESSELFRDTDRVIQQFIRLDQALREAGQGGMEFTLTEFVADLERSEAEAQKLLKQLEMLAQVQERLNQGAQTTRLSPEEQAGFERTPWRGTASNVEQEVLRIQEELLQITKIRTDLEDNFQARARANQIEMLDLTTRRQFIEERILAIASGDVRSEILNVNLQQLEEQLRVLERQEQLMVSQAQAAIGRTGGAQVADRALAAEMKILNLKEQQDRINEKILSTIEEISQAREQGGDRAVDLAERLQDLEQRRMVTAQAIVDLERRFEETGGAGARREAVIDIAPGAREAIAEIRQRIEELKAQREELMASGVDAIAPELRELEQALADSLKSNIQNEESYERQVQLVNEIEDVKRAATARPQTDMEAFQAEIAQLPRLERALFSAFDNIGRRFRTAFQFAVSGAILYGAQRLAREFVSSAIEVERTFVDIQSALQFNLEDQGIMLGTAAFDREVEGIRRNVLQLANDFNVLPPQANAVAYNMVARFRDMDHAMEATRAQLLAIRVSSISADEALRALSATAEGFADQVLRSAGADFAGGLMDREAAQAENYAKALDIATIGQQRFGVPLEDMIEGMARAATTFGQLGFSMEQTGAIVGAVSRTLSQTGHQVAERLNRALGGLTTPEVRDQLLELAAASQELNLTLLDFESGARVIETIITQIQRLQQLEPQTAIQIRDILGQRRETEVIAAMLGTPDLQREMVAAFSNAAGAAEKRFAFLETTISERIASILAQFDSLAQNFERLNLFAPFRVMLAAVDNTLELMNRLLQMAQDFWQWTDRIGEGWGVKVGSALRTALTIVLSMAATMRAVTASMTVVTGLVGAAAGRAGLGALGTAASAAAASLTTMRTQIVNSGGFIRQFYTALGLMATGVRGVLRRIGDAVATFLVRFRTFQNPAVLNNFIRGLGAATIALPLFISAISAAIEGARRTREATTRLQSMDERIELEMRRRVRVDGPFDSEETRRVVQAEKELADLRETAAKNANNWFQQALGSSQHLNEAMIDTLGLSENLSSALKRILDDPNIGWNLRHGASDPRLILNTDEFWDFLIEQAQREFAEALAASIHTNLAKGQLRDTGAGRFGEANELFRALGDATNAVLQAETPEDLEKAILLLRIVEQQVEDYLEGVGLSTKALDDSFAELRRELGELDRSLSVGRMSPEQARRTVSQLSDRAMALAKEHADMLDELRDGVLLPQDQRDLEERLNFAYSLLSRTLDEITGIFQRQREGLRAIPDEAMRLQLEAQSLQAELDALLTSNVQADSARIRDLMRDIDDAQRQATQVTKQRAIETAERAMKMASSRQEWEQASADWLQAIRDSIQSVSIDVFRPPDIPDFMWNLMRRFLPESFTPQSEMVRIQRETEDAQQAIIADRARFVEAIARRQGPIRNEIVRINARLKGLLVSMEGMARGSAEYEETRNQVLEERASLVEAEMNQVAANIRLQAGVADSIRSLQAEISIATRQMTVMANLYGRDSIQWSQLALSRQRLQQEMVNARIELETLGRRMDTDVTNQFEQAQLDLAQVMRQLSQVDMGPLERARAEMQRRQLEASAERAFFEDRMFQMRFAFETGELGLSGYISSLRRLLESVDTGTQQGKEIFLQIQDLIDSLINDIDMQFNIPDSIRLPTLFEVRRALAADQLGVNYMDNRVIDVSVNVDNPMELEEVLRTIDRAFGDSSSMAFRRSAVGQAGILSGSF